MKIEWKNDRRNKRLKEIATKTAHRKQESRDWCIHKMKTNHMKQIEENKFYCKITKLLCIFGQSFRLSSINVGIIGLAFIIYWVFYFFHSSHFLSIFFHFYHSSFARSHYFSSTMFCAPFSKYEFHARLMLHYSLWSLSTPLMD